MKQVRNKPGRQGGFTLTELAIVLVVAGLLIGGVMKGADMIKKAKAERFVADLTAISGSVLEYQKQRGRLPGDCNNDGVIGSAALPGTAVWGGGPYDNSATDPSTAGGGVCTTTGTTTAETNVNIAWNDMRAAGIFERTRVNQSLAKHQNNDYFVLAPVTAGGTSANAIVIYGIPLWLAEALDTQIDGLNNGGLAGRLRYCGAASITAATCAGTAFPDAATDRETTVAVSYQYDGRVLPTATGS